VGASIRSDENPLRKTQVERDVRRHGKDLQSPSPSAVTNGLDWPTSFVSRLTLDISYFARDLSDHNVTVSNNRRGRETYVFFQNVMIKFID